MGKLSLGRGWLRLAVVASSLDRYCTPHGVGHSGTVVLYHGLGPMKSQSMEPMIEQHFQKVTKMQKL